MTRQSDFKRRYDPKIGRYVKKHIHTGEIHGEGLMDILKSIGSKLFGKTAKEITKKAATKAATKTAEKTGEFIGIKAGDKIVKLLSKKKPNNQTIQQKGVISPDEYDGVIQPKKMTDFEIARRVNQLISGGKIRKR